MDQIPENSLLFQNALKTLKLLSVYHRYEALGLEHIPSHGGAILVVNHSFATYDTLLLGARIYEKTGRYSKGLADRRIFQTPFLSDLFTALGLQEGSPQVAEQLLSSEQLLALSPGGMRESLRPVSERYKINWQNRLGFVRLSIKTQKPIILAACPAADDLFTLYDNPITPFIYHNFKWPVPILRGWGLSLLPRPIKLVHRLAPPLYPPAILTSEGGVPDEVTRDFHSQVVEKMNSLLVKAKS